MSDTPDEARKQAQWEDSQNMGPANTSAWDATVREAYEAERDRLSKQQQNSSGS